jgi:hypothetical protein
LAPIPRISDEHPLQFIHRSRETPQVFFDKYHAVYGFTLDVCAVPQNAKCPRFFGPAEDGLKQPWTGVCWMNPPYGRTIGQWMAKAFASFMEGATSFASFLPSTPCDDFPANFG